ncbi:MAG: DUF2914 domain-containing protein [Patescibacteria group bacterium]
MKDTIKNIYEWIRRNDRYLSAGALLSGFIVDTLTLRRVDLPLENIIMLTYFSVVSIGIIVLHIYDTRKLQSVTVHRVVSLIPLVIQFAFGALFSGFTVFYFRSGSLATSWPLIAVLVGLLIANEMLRRHYARLVLQVSILFTALFFFLIFFIPVLLGKMGPWIFLLSGISALALVSFFIAILAYFVPRHVSQSRNFLLYSIGTVFIGINILYFTNIIPPIPLSLKEAGVYQRLIKTGRGYIGFHETPSRWSWIDLFENVNLVEGQALYVYSSVFAPTDIDVEVVHHWKHFDEEASRWRSINKIPYTIVGGNDRGYRGYSMKQNLMPGNWEVAVETLRGQVIGRILFEISYVDDQPHLLEYEL